MKRRNESCFGLHFDFHATPGCTKDGIGNTLTESEIREICTLLRPDFIQIDCKGHPGWASYPTECGNAMPVFAQDPLALWRRVTREEGVALFMHYSGVMDELYCTKHPENAVLNADGKRDVNVTRTYGLGYDDDVLIPQLKELAGKYGVDGVWVDGECWATKTDFDPVTLIAFENVNNVTLEKPPFAETDPYYHEYRDFCRELFRKHVAYYTEQVHKKYPEFQIASNWAYTDYMPEPVTADVDFLSGDLSAANSFVSARYAGRAVALHKRPWDLMAWNFRWRVEGRGGNCVKHINQILQEAAAVISLGGGFQNYIPQYPDGSPRMYQIRKQKPLADFIRARQDKCFGGELLPQVAVLLSATDRRKEKGTLFTREGNDKIMGLVSLICDAGHSSEITEEHTLDYSIKNNPVIVVPETCSGIGENNVRKLLEYANNGGNLLIIGANSCGYFKDHGLDVSLSDVCDKAMQFTKDNEELALVYDCVSIQSTDVEVLYQVCKSPREESAPFAVIKNYGKGRVALIGADIGTQYMSMAQYMHISLISDMLDKLYEPVVKVVECEGILEISDLIKDGRLMIQLVNANGAHKDGRSLTEDRIIPVRNAVVSIKCENRPKNLVIWPENRSLDFEWDNGKAVVKIDRVDIHSIVEVIK